MTLEHIAPMLDRKAIARALLHSSRITYAKIAELTGLKHHQVKYLEPLVTGLSTEEILALASELPEVTA